ncbi:DUF4157 domain-containing protein [Mucilaginibacter sp. L196]|uniref:eCIS core domain-containing protein n=1 Tax=Mucilaginibacter sp. L196 TaxID=1641870 RepID=UPI00131C17CF|nr:DUF4157 domain-containing protein [Mucilaginibacter sp. L196]
MNDYLKAPTKQNNQPTTIVGAAKKSAAQLQDNRPKSVVQKKQAEALSNKNIASPIQKMPNKTGLPDQLKAGVENLSGYSMDDVKVHYNSVQPAQLNAHAYAQGTDIHIASGQEKHLPHEAWHVVQQKQGRVKPTLQMKGKVNVNDDKGLEKEADVMGELANKTNALRSVSTPLLQAHYNEMAEPLVQRMVNFTATQYQQQEAPGGNLTLPQLKQYLKFFINSDLILAQGYADNGIAATGPLGVAFPIGVGQGHGEIGALTAYRTAIAAAAVGAPPTLAANIAAADGLAVLINTILGRAIVNIPDYAVAPALPGALPGAMPTGVAANIPVPHSQTAYSVAPVLGYAHQNARPLWLATYDATPGNHQVKTAAANLAAPLVTWVDEATGQAAFGRAAGAALLAAPRVTHDAQVARPQIKQLTWSQAQEFLPKPLLNLLFNVKRQLNGGPMVDERTPLDQHALVRNATSTVPGTLRSWHEDSAGMLPANGLAGAANGQAVAVPAPAAALHAHYTATSRTGAGAAAGGVNAPVAPVGFAEYTGAGTAHIHNIKVVLDYINTRVYLTLSHYQYWALVINGAGQHEFIAGGSQNRAAAQITIEANPTVVAAAAALPPRAYTMMNPWLEILV